MAKRSQFYAVASDAEGNSLEDITVTVYNVGTEVEASIYTSRVGGSTAPSEFDTAADGEITFWAEPGAYDIHLEDATIPARIAEKTITWDSISGDVQGIDGNAIEALGIDGFRLADGSVTPRTVSIVTQTGNLGADATLSVANTWYNGPSIQVTQGTGLYDVRGTHRLVNEEAASTTITFRSRIAPFGDSPFDVKEFSYYRAAGGTIADGIPFTHSRYVQLTDDQVVLLQGSCSLGATLGGKYIDASNAVITATRVA